MNDEQARAALRHGLAHWPTDELQDLARRVAAILMQRHSPCARLSPDGAQVCGLPSDGEDKHAGPCDWHAARERWEQGDREGRCCATIGPPNEHLQAICMIDRGHSTSIGHRGLSRNGMNVSWPATVELCQHSDCGLPVSQCFGQAH